MKNQLTKPSSWISGVIIIVIACANPIDDPIEDVHRPKIGIDIVKLPVVFHVLYDGATSDYETNMSNEKIMNQILTLNNDFRRKPGTRGFNSDIGIDTKIEFVLANKKPDGTKFSGINRIDISKYNFPFLGFNQNHYAQYIYWDPASYINIWIVPLPLESQCLVLGIATGPKVNLPGNEYLSLPEPGDAEGIILNQWHVGESDLTCHARHGRTLTHEMGHYLGLLHIWGDGNCSTNDYCDDTPPVNRPIFGNEAILGCRGDVIPIGNYMTYQDDAIMNHFTPDQAKRIYYVLNNHSGRKSLISSTVISSN